MGHNGMLSVADSPWLASAMAQSYRDGPLTAISLVAMAAAIINDVPAISSDRHVICISHHPPCSVWPSPSRLCSCRLCLGNSYVKGASRSKFKWVRRVPATWPTS
ncbi:hypothetical protein H310_08128 [Aphanomyces invadans]|uniref:Uncharacterized protein n=1 Tax=Aphanomyces invadans TaxID=157072 RepID=A0A024U0P2_9STRA|nr:hypothetical protein H310_08128 [Aphanomyces invadans]ETV99436.1 hypothetical protein H310_08128 [Aphanomyces invadans]|eukprot:XP_008871992.1 hypothetical protein H310_08128 [Aphanomyces invadans]